MHAEQSDDNSTLEELEKLLNDEEFCRIDTPQNETPRKCI